MAVACPLCCGTSVTSVRRFSLDDATRLFVGVADAARMRAILARLWQADHVRILRCNRCELGFADPFVSGNAAFYQLQAPDTPYPPDKWEYRRTLAALAGMPARARLLDVGAGSGQFLSHLLRRGWQPAQLAATEFSRAGAAAIERLGVPCVQQDVRQLPAAHEFDIICMFQVLEHLDGYADLLDALARLGTQGAQLFIAVPNGRRIDDNERAGLQYDCPPNHISRWTPASFRMLAATYGWRLEACELEPPATMRQEFAYAAVNRYLRRSHEPGTWAGRTYRAAERVAARGSRANKLIKALGMAVSPDAWLAGLRGARRSRGGATPHAIWVHLRRAT